MKPIRHILKDGVPHRNDSTFRRGGGDGSLRISFIMDCKHLSVFVLPAVKKYSKDTIKY